MCGITAILNCSALPSIVLVQATQQVSHRGPDDEGYLLWSPERHWRLFAGKDTSVQSRQAHALEALPTQEMDWKVGLGHRRLSILDLSAAGHQPMLEDDRWAITYNGEIFNYLEIRETLEKEGVVFYTGSDTEVILKAWNQWGADCLHHFNGMFAFVLLDRKEQKMWAVRDRFGIKPLYYTCQTGYTALASEVKQLRVLPEYSFSLNHKIAGEYLNDSMLDHSEETFEEEILQVSPGGLLVIDLQTRQLEVRRWYELKPVQWEGTEAEAIQRFEQLLRDSVQIRMRSDVPVGAALSGGLDSSVLVGIMHQLLEHTPGQPLTTISSCSTDKQFDEWPFAEAVIRKVKAVYYQVFPSFEKLTTDFERLLWYMDYPFLGTSQFSQWCVFEEAGRRKLPVMINGQGADEQLAGYGGNEMPLYTGLMRRGAWRSLWSEVNAYRRYKGHWPSVFIAGALQSFIPRPLYRRLPSHWQFFKVKTFSWLKMKKTSRPLPWYRSLRDSLRAQVLQSPLPSLLRYDDRNSMAFSVESRVPFMDHRLIEFTLGLPEDLVYQKGERKYILRKAFAHVLPPEVLNRKDKMGFVSSEERWIKEEGKDWFEYKLKELTSLPENLIDPAQALSYLRKVQQGDLPFGSEVWRMVCFSQWLRQMKQYPFSYSTSARNES